MSNADLSQTCKTLAELVTRQLVVRVVLCGRTHLPGCRIELMSSLKEFERNKGLAAFAHVQGNFYYDESHRLVDTFEFEMSTHPKAGPHNGNGEFYDDVYKVVHYWQRNVTPDTETPKEEWLTGKPFVGVLTLGRGGSLPVHTLELPQDAPSFLGYYGLFRAQLSARLQTAVATASWNKELARQEEVLRHVSRRFDELFMQTQQRRFLRSLEAA